MQQKLIEIIEIVDSIYISHVWIIGPETLKRCKKLFFLGKISLSYRTSKYRVRATKCTDSSASELYMTSTTHVFPGNEMCEYRQGDTNLNINSDRRCNNFAGCDFDIKLTLVLSIPDSKT